MGKEKNKFKCPECEDGRTAFEGDVCDNCWKEPERDICPECLKECYKRELEMFGGLCEDCMFEE